jgi:apolipoprotein N-acyltransferase
MQRHAWRQWGAAALSAGLLELPFPLAGPMPPWRSLFAWFGLVPLLWAVLSPDTAAAARRPMRQAFLLGYLCGFLWYMGNCYWVRDTMSRYGDMPPLAPTLLLVGFSLVLGLYCGLFALGLMLVRRATGQTKWALFTAPFLWTALDLLAARLTSVPWDQLGYSQVDNGFVNRLAPWTGVYGITFLIVALNSVWTAFGKGLFPLRRRSSRRAVQALAAGLAIGIFWGGVFRAPRTVPAPATAVLVQPNLDVGSESNWNAPGEWEQHFGEFTRLAGERCKSYIAGIPQTGAPDREAACPPPSPHPDFVAWPESPAPFFQSEPRFREAVGGIARASHSAVLVGGIGSDFSSDQQSWLDYNSAMLFGPDGQFVRRYDKIHLVPFGEFVPYANLLSFAKKLTGRVGRFERGAGREPLTIASQDGQRHRYGVFICYEAVFADEVRHFAANGAEVLVNISDDGWYGDTSAPWQHLNMARMRAIENRRWLLRDTNNGVTAAIDPYGRVRQSIPRHQADALPAQYGFRTDITFYSAHGDLFAWLCAILSLGTVAGSINRVQKTAAAAAQVQVKVRS